MKGLDLLIDVTEAADFGEPATMAVTVHLPHWQDLGLSPIVCFAKPGGGFGRGYYTVDLPGPASGAEANWHANRGWIFVSVDHLGVGGSSTHEMDLTDYATVARAADAAEQEILRRLRVGSITDDFPAITDPTVLGIGQSLGGCLTVVQQAHHHTYDGIAVLGYGVLHSRVGTPKGASPVVQAWTLRDSPHLVLNMGRVEAARASGTTDITARSRWCFFYDDVDPELVHHGDFSMPWASSTYPGAIRTVLTPGVVSSEAASIDVPVLIASGERDVVADPQGEVRAYFSASSVDLFVCPRMGHMHNFAGTRELLWHRLEAWSAWVRSQRTESHL